MTSRRPGVLIWAVLSISPVLLLVIGLALKAMRGPYWLAFNSDPEYAYLFNSLLILEGRPPFHIDHPGTPVQSLGAAIIAGVFRVDGQDRLLADVVARPELYLKAIHLGILLTTSALVFTAGWIVLRHTRRLAPALLIQLGPWLSIQVLDELARVRPEPLLAGISVLSGAATLIWANRPKDAQRRGALVLGALVGLALATKITAVPLMIAPLILFGEWKARRMFFGTTVLAFLVAILPALPKLPSIGNWSIKLLVHAGDYGSGAMSIVNPTAYLPALWSLVGSEPIAIAVVLCSALMWWHWRGSSQIDPNVRWVRRALGAALATQVAQFLIVAKHPAPHYLLPAISMLGINLAAIGQYGRVSAAARTARPVLLGLVLTVLGFQSLALGSQARALSAAAIDQERIAQVTDAMTDTLDCVAIYHYRSSSRAYALQFGNLLSKFGGLNTTPLLQERYPEVRFDRGGFNIQDFQWQVPVDPRSLFAAYDCVLLEGTTRNQARLPPGYAADVVLVSGEETLSRLRLVPDERATP